MAYDGSGFSSDTTYSDDTAYGATGHEGHADSMSENDSWLRSDPREDSAIENSGVDRLTVHMVWEGILLLFGGALIFLLHRSDPSALHGSAVKDLLMTATIVGLVAIATGMTLRTCVVNLALGPLTYASAMFFAEHSDAGLIKAAGITALVAAGLGAGMAIISWSFRLPNWVMSLGVGLAVIAWLEQQGKVSVVNGAYQPSHHVMFWFVGFVLLAAMSGLFGWLRIVRKLFVGVTPLGDGHRRPSTRAGIVMFIATVCSSVIAAVAGIMFALNIRSVDVSDNGLSLSGLSLTALGLGAALLGGTSIYGRYGGIMGVSLSVVVIITAWRYGIVKNWNISFLAIGGIAILVGLIVVRVIDAFGSSDKEDDGEFREWMSMGGPSRQASEGWSSAKRSDGWGPRGASDDEWRAVNPWGVQ